MSKIVITRADEVLATLEKQSFAAVLSIEHPGAHASESKRGAAPRLTQHPQLILEFWDVESMANQGPTYQHVKQGVDFVLQHIEKGDVLIHCAAGIARSTAMALGVLAIIHKEKSAEELIRMLLEIRPIAAPNIFVVEMVDDLAGRNGTLYTAVLNDKTVSEQRALATKAREAYRLRHPEVYRAMHPEKFPKNN